MEFLLHIYRGFIAWFIWMNAVTHVSKKDYGRAMISLRRIYKVYGKAPPSTSVDVGTNLLCALLALRLNEDDLCIKCVALAITQLQTNKYFSANEVVYLRVYAKCILESIDENIYPEAAILANGIIETYDTINFVKIRPEVRDHFPITDHGTRSD